MAVSAVRWDLLINACVRRPSRVPHARCKIRASPIHVRPAKLSVSSRNSLFQKGQNGGQCTNMAGTPTCRCPTGFTGPRCEQQEICGVKNPCICGTCQNDPSNPLGFKCFCPPGYSGQRCERAL